APIVDGHDVTTMLILLAMGESGPKAADNKAWSKAMDWLKKHAPSDETQPLALRVLVALQSGDGGETRRAVKLLRATQEANGGWSQKKGRPADALATGQALYALGAAGASSDDSAVQQAWGFLAAAQRKDGSWLVESRNPNSHPPVISYFATGWATLGL